MPSNYRDKDGRNPFSDEHGDNPFADDVAGAELGDDSNPYYTQATQVEYAPDEFEPFLAPRPGKIIGLAVVGLVLAGLGVLFLFSMAFLYQFAPLGMFALVFSLPAFFKARCDLQAIKKGAMARDKEGATRLGMVLAILGAAIGLSVGVVAVAGAFFVPGPL